MRRVSPEETEGEEKERLALSCGEKGNKSSNREESRGIMNSLPTPSTFQQSLFSRRARSRVMLVRCSARVASRMDFSVGATGRSERT